MAMLNYQMVYDFNNCNYMIWIDMGVILISGKFILVSPKSTSSTDLLIHQLIL